MVIMMILMMVLMKIIIICLGGALGETNALPCSCSKIMMMILMVMLHLVVLNQSLLIEAATIMTS